MVLPVKREPGAGSGLPRILFLDDEADIVDAFVVAAQLSGIEARGFVHPLRALECFRRESPTFRAVITDFTMPDMNCSDFVAALRDVRPDVPIHLCTGNAEHDILQAAERLGVRSILYKPFDVDALEAFLGAILGTAG